MSLRKILGLQTWTSFARVCEKCPPKNFASSGKLRPISVLRSQTSVNRLEPYSSFNWSRLGPNGNDDRRQINRFQRLPITPERSSLRSNPSLEWLKSTDLNLHTRTVVSRFSFLYQWTRRFVQMDRTRRVTEPRSGFKSLTAFKPPAQGAQTKPWYTLFPSTYHPVTAASTLLVEGRVP